MGFCWLISNLAMSQNIQFVNESVQYQLPILIGVVLLFQYYIPSDQNKRVDIDSALIKNLMNIYISEIYILNEKEINFSGNYNIYDYNKY